MRRVKMLEDLAPDSPAIRRLINAIAVVVDLFKLSMASMLAVFVPQSCPGNEENIPGGSGNCTDIVGVHDCSFEENFRCLTPYNQFVLATNFICLFALVCHYVLVWRRETFMVEHFKESLEYGRLHLRSVIQDYPTVAIRLHRANKWVFNVSVIVVVLQRQR